MNFHEIKRILEKIAPLETQASWDNSGVQICFGPKDINTILVALEISDAVIDEAISEKADMIVTHHPLIFNPIKSIHICRPESKYIIRLIKNDIAVYSSHTPFDIAKGGNTDYLLKLLKLKKIKTVEGTDGFLKTGELENETSLGDLAYRLSEMLKLDGLKFTGDAEKTIKTVACCTGAGGEFWKDAFKISDVLITGDVKHHDAALASDAGFAVIDAGHWGTEQIFVKNMASQLRKAAGKEISIIESSVNQDPFNFML